MVPEMSHDEEREQAGKKRAKAEFTYVGFLSRHPPAGTTKQKANPLIQDWLE